MRHFMRLQEMIKYENMAYARPISIFSSRIFRSFPTILGLLEPKMKRKKCYTIICLKNNGHQGLKGDKVCFRVDNTSIL